MLSRTESGSFAFLAGEGEVNIGEAVRRLVLAGLINSLIVAWLLCRLPNAPAPTLFALFFRALFYVSAAALGGLVGVWFYWNRSSSRFVSGPPLSFGLFVLVNASAWVWVPSVWFLSRQDAWITAPLAALGGALLATGLRKFIPLKRPLLQASLGLPWPDRELFAESIHTAPREVDGYVIALCIYAAGYALVNRSTLIASALLAPCAFLIAWKLTLDPDPALEIPNRSTRAAERFGRIALAAVLVTVVVLFVGVAKRNQGDAVFAHGKTIPQGGESEQASKLHAQGSASGISGYESIILWPIPEKKQIIPPLPAPTSLLAPGTTKPLVLRFDGPYWYFQPPGKRPGALAHQARGNPLALDIESHNFIPLIMEAHQSLGGPIRLSRCREIQIAILNRDNRPGVVNLGVLLTDSASSAKPTFYLGQQPVVTSQPGSFSIKSAPAYEVLRFPIPVPAKIRKFDEITVMFLPDGEGFEAGPKIAIQQFDLLPR